MLGSHDDRFRHDCSVMYVQSKRTDGPQHNDHIYFIYWVIVTDPHDHVSNLQQPEGCPCGNEPWSQKADAGEVPQHGQVWGYQWADDEVRSFSKCKCLVRCSCSNTGIQVICFLLPNWWFKSDPLLCSLQLSGGQTFQKVRQSKTGSTT